MLDNIVRDVSVIKDQYQIHNNLRSCHSAQKANYTIEEYIPIKSTTNFLEKTQGSN